MQTQPQSFNNYPIWQERRAEAAIGRMCRPKARSGAVEASQELQRQFKAGGATRMKLIREYMAAADKDCSAQLYAIAQNTQHLSCVISLAYLPCVCVCALSLCRMPLSAASSISNDRPTGRRSGGPLAGSARTR